MNTLRAAIVLGTSHRVQGCKFPESVVDPSYSKLLRELIKDNSVDFVFEEASGKGPSTAECLCRSLRRVRYLDVDPPVERRHEFGIARPSGEPYPEFLSSDQHFEKIEEDSQREELWCKRILGEDFKAGLVICGCLHTTSIANRLRLSGIRVKFQAHLPHDVLSSHKRSTRTLVRNSLLPHIQMSLSWEVAEK